MATTNRGIDYPKIALLLNKKYEDYNRPEFIAPDPLMVVREYGEMPGREFAAFIASQFAMGRACSISDTARTILGSICRAATRKTDNEYTTKPQDALLVLDQADLVSTFKDFAYRFFNAQDLVSLLLSLRSVYRSYGSLENLLGQSLSKTARDLVPALTLFVGELERANPLLVQWKPNLVASPKNGSACKRLLLFLRWLVRTDSIDPGGWSILSPAELLAPLDTHAIRSYRQLGFIQTNAVTMKTVLAVTGHLRNIAPEDPLKYDFALSRPYANCE